MRQWLFAIMGAIALGVGLARSYQRGTIILSLAILFALYTAIGLITLDAKRYLWWYREKPGPKHE
jgi:hypothetical protein